MENLSTRYKTFLGFILLTFIFNMWILNDVLELWNKVEIPLLERVGAPFCDFPNTLDQVISVMLSLPMLIYKGAYLFFEDTFVCRLLGGLFLMICTYYSYLFGSKIFSEERMRLSVLVLFSSYFMVNAAKVVNTDIWIGAIQMLVFILSILYLKKPTKRHEWMVHGTSFLAVLVAPFPNLIFVVGLHTYLRFMHPNGKTAFYLPTIAYLPIAIGIIWTIFNRGLIWSWAFPIDYLIYTFLGMLLFLPFLLPALWSLIIRVKKREEFSILLFGGLLMGLLTLSLSVQFFFAILIAKQLQDFFKANYPYGNFAKVLSILLMVGGFLVAIFYMVSNFQEYGAAGFRAAMVMSLVYWIPSLVMIVGMYGKKQNMVYGGIFTAGVLTTFTFWMYIVPLLFEGWLIAG